MGVGRGWAVLGGNLEISPHPTLKRRPRGLRAREVVASLVASLQIWAGQGGHDAHEATVPANARCNGTQLGLFPAITKHVWGNVGCAISAGSLKRPH